jgi:lipopolysaccharide/colanic/teichoic acid biosynthesis glycosyltransferase
MSRRGFIALSVVVDALLVNAGFVLAFLLRFEGTLPDFNFRAYVLLAPLLTLLYLAGAWTYGLYDPERADTAWAVVRGAVAAVTMGTLLTAAVAFFGGARTASFARSTILIAWVFDLALLTGWRLVFLRLGRVSWPEQRVLIVGTGDTALDLAREVAARSRWGWRVTGLIEAGPESAQAPPPSSHPLPAAQAATPAAQPASAAAQPATPAAQPALAAASRPAPAGSLSASAGPLSAAAAPGPPPAAGALTQASAYPAELGGFPVLGAADDVARLAAEHRANRVIVVSPIALRELVESLVLADEADVRVDVVPELYEIFIGTVDAIVGDVPLMEITHTSVPTYYAATKRAIDVAAAALLLVVLSPVLLATVIAVAVADGMPAFFSQDRVGRGLRTFRIHKLRTMVRDAERDSGPVMAAAGDERITRVGRFLRRYRLDEIPQLVNIIRGDMSFVGPRPERPFFVERFMADTPGYRERFSIRPGVTGLAQVSGGYATTPERKLKYDLIYMYHQTPAMDAQIVAETLRVVLTGRGAR